MPKLKVDLEMLDSALDDASSWERRYFLDLETGEIVMVTEDESRELERIYKELGDEANSAERLAEAFKQSNLPDWEKELLPIADQIEKGYGTRYLHIEPLDLHAGYNDMEDFIETVKDERLQDRLLCVIKGTGAFRRFKDVLANHPQERERWFAFSDGRGDQRAKDWLEEHGVEPIED